MSARFVELLDHLHGHAPRVLTATASLGAQALADAVARLAASMQIAGLTRVASRLDNGPDWLILDLALRLIDAVHVPLPTFFSDAQVLHALTSSGAQCVVTDLAAAAPAGSSGPLPAMHGDSLRFWRVAAVVGLPTLPEATACITYTSGTTGRPKGVCLSADSLLTVAGSLVDASSAIAPRRHLCLMPLSTLLENVAGLYATLLSGAQVALPSLAQIGYTGASGLDGPTLLRCLHQYQPESVILVPQLLLALVSAAEQGVALPASLRYIAVGGGHIGPSLLARAAALGLPVFEGYGLTECGSVVCLNRPGAVRAGSVGQVLAHARVQIVDGEIQVDGVRALGYLGEEALPPGPVRTGDLGYVDHDGFVHITGRRKHVFITAFGRNVSPEWVESELLQHPLLAQAVVWGEAQADNVAVLWPRRPDSDDAAIAKALAEVNAGLPDYARVARFVRADAPFSALQGLLTANGRPRRDAILARYQSAVDRSYRSPATVVSQGISP
ncbi:AMP-binding protein [Xanthomonas nasturtii]|uniref:AMP-binding protein n=1 Tax=Xanthomonas nasturtii TaxID=1843581 RepID=UPI0020129256|nr:AMP-binding protein [Xanthomonas nasturtii]MCL1527109.1 AMP-binding protein [Xanthomonas nasturtii]MCL1536099.1 AMP-binding protein [Xanthomonas nasturtii]MCL1544781.1 AMP-binding protein [Xanthomonas nasturtii]